MTLTPLPASFATTRESLRALACYVLAPARRAGLGGIQLEPTSGGFGTPVLRDGSRFAVRGSRLMHTPNGDVPITTLAAAAAFAQIELVADPQVGSDLPPFDPAAVLPVDEQASLALGEWYAFGDDMLRQVMSAETATSWDPVHLWPEHFDLATIACRGHGQAVAKMNIGVSPGDTFSQDPYVYVGPWDRTDLSDPFWNAPFGAVLTRAQAASATDPMQTAVAFCRTGLALALGE